MKLRNSFRLLFNKLDPIECATILHERNAYFAALNTKDKARFIRRLLKFIDSVSFSSEQGFEVDNRIKVIVASAFIQITFGLKEYTLKAHNRIFIAPASYTYPGYNKLMSGDVNLETKTISLSWPAVVQGFEVPDDAVNIAIHEFGHCLTFENFSRPYLGRFFEDNAWKDWTKHAAQKLAVIKSGQNQFIRKYGGTNLMELFAVALENFFERPELFSEHLPEFYRSLTILLNQDPVQMEAPVINRLR